MGAQLNEMCHACFWIYLISYHHSWRHLQCWHQVSVSFFNSALIHLVRCMLKLIPQNHFASDYDLSWHLSLFCILSWAWFILFISVSRKLCVMRIHWNWVVLS